MDLGLNGELNPTHLSILLNHNSIQPIAWQQQNMHILNVFKSVYTDDIDEGGCF